jgi:hypothetical protein
MSGPTAWIRCIWPGLVIAALLGAGCDSRGTQGGRSAPPDTGHTPPLVGGACLYDRFVFRAAVDSVLPDGALLVRPDTGLTTRRRCDRVEEVRPGQWRAPRPVSGPAPVSGDSVEVAAEVIVTGTCVPCTANTRVVSGSR